MLELPVKHVSLDVSGCVSNHKPSKIKPNRMDSFSSDALKHVRGPAV